VPKITQQTSNYLLLKGIFRIQTEYFLALIIRWSQEISARKIENQKWQHIARARKNRVLEQVVQLKNWEMTLKVFDRPTLAGYLLYVSFSAMTIGACITSAHDQYSVEHFCNDPTGPHSMFTFNL